MSAPMLMTTSAISARVFMRSPIENDSFQGRPLARAASDVAPNFEAQATSDDQAERRPEPRVRAERADVRPEPREDEEDREKEDRDEIPDRMPDPLRELPIEGTGDPAQEPAEYRKDTERVGRRRRKRRRRRGRRRACPAGRPPCSALLRPAAARGRTGRAPRTPCREPRRPRASAPERPKSAFPCVTIATTAPRRIQPSTSSIAAAVIEVRPMRVRVRRVWMRIRPMTGIAVIDTAVAKKSRNASSGAGAGAIVKRYPASA